VIWRISVPWVVSWITVRPVGGVSAPVPVAVSTAIITFPDATPVGLVIARLVAPLPVVAALLAATKLIAACAQAGASAKLTITSRPRLKILAR
jgi:hypothetical protein